jgi:HlyD family secretion protein
VWLFVGATLLIVVALGWAFAPRPVEVEVERATVGHFETVITEDGRTRLRERYALSAPLSGALERITLREGDAVAAGAVLARIHPLPAPLLDSRSRREAQARIDAAQAQWRAATSRVDSAALAAQRSRDTLQRLELLAAQGYVSDERLAIDRQVAQAAAQGLETATAERDAAASALAQARAALLVTVDAATATPGRGAAPYSLRAPVAGRILRVLQASAGSVTAGTPLLEMGDTAQLEVIAPLLTSDARQAVPGTPVRISGLAQREVAGQVRQVEPAGFTKISALGVEEQRVHVLIDLAAAPPASATGDTPPGDGWRVGVTLVTRQVEQALRVPVSAVFPLPVEAAADTVAVDAERRRMAVFTVEGGRARQVEVTLGGRNGSQAWVLKGLTPGASVIVYPGTAVSDGVRVAVRKV